MSLSRFLFAGVFLICACGDDGGTTASVDAAAPFDAAIRPDAMPAVTCDLLGKQSDFACTQVIGFSQTSNWYGAEDMPLFEAHQDIDGDRWQLLWHAGAGVENWATPKYEGWDPQITPLVSACATSSDAPDRVVLTISSNVYDTLSPTTEWAAEIDKAVAEIRTKIPTATDIILQPVVGGTADNPCPTRASENHPIIAAAIELVVDGETILAGPEPMVLSCTEFSDDKGHLTPATRQANALRIAGCYAH